MSSNLTISYTSQTAAGTAPAGAAPADASAPGSPLGFFAALIDQLVAQITSGDTKPEEQQPETTAVLGQPEQHDLPLGYVEAPVVPARPQTGAGLLADLTAQLETLQTQGAPATPEQLKQLDDTFASLTAALALIPSSTTTNAPAKPADKDIAQLLASLGFTGKTDAAKAVATEQQHLLTLSQSFAATAPSLAGKLEALAGQIAELTASPDRLAAFTGEPPADTGAMVADIVRRLLGATGTDNASSANPGTGDQLQQILATLGLGAATPPAPNTPVVATAVPAPLLRLSTQLSQLGTALAGSAPELAQKLEAVATRLVAGDADPKLFAQLTSAASSTDGAALDQLLRQLLDPKPATPVLPTTPQLAVTAKLDIPASPTLVLSKSAVAEVKAAQPQPAPVTADSAPDPTPRIDATASADRSPEPAQQAKPEAKAAAIIAETGKADPASANNVPPQAAPPVVPAASVRPLPVAYQAAANPINMGQMAFEMVRQVQQGSSRFTLRLDPPELGRVDVRMHVDPQGGVTARLTVERAETLDMFQRDQRQLERALAQAGLDSARTTLEFSLRQNPNPGGDQRQQQHQDFATPRFALGGDNDNAAVPAVTLYRGIASAGGVNIFA
ncbi:MAG: flagellar hook-length control protein FliK [Hyphomicrobiales bacterium]|nr:MAG: flagellar hook-length control protein FliK [Hyphomicrobiales bacterium]